MYLRGAIDDQGSRGCCWVPGERNLETLVETVGGGHGGEGKSGSFCMGRGS